MRIQHLLHHRPAEPSLHGGVTVQEDVKCDVFVGREGFASLRQFGI